MKSLRVRLFAILVLATGLIWLSAVAWIYLGSKREVEQVLDNRLQEAARTVSSLVGAVGGTDPNGGAEPSRPRRPTSGSFPARSGRSTDAWSHGRPGPRSDV